MKTSGWISLRTSSVLFYLPLSSYVVASNLTTRIHSENQQPASHQSQETELELHQGFPLWEMSLFDLSGCSLEDPTCNALYLSWLGTWPAWKPERGTCWTHLQFFLTSQLPEAVDNSWKLQADPEAWKEDGVMRCLRELCKALTPQG